MSVNEPTAFLPSANRAAGINRTLARALARSIREIARASGYAAQDFESVCEAIAGAAAVDPMVYALHYDALSAARADDPDQVHAALSMLSRSPLPAQPFHATPWEALSASRSAAFLRCVNNDPDNLLAFADLGERDARASLDVVHRALELLDEAAPDLTGEIRELVRELVLVKDAGAGGASFDGATSFYAWGALFLNAEHHEDAPEMATGIAHEAAHAYLFGAALGAPLVTNPPEERFVSPLRPDPRPLDGVFHATFVSARMHYAQSRMLVSRLLTPAEADRVAGARRVARSAYEGGRQTLDAHAQLTALGREMLDAASLYMDADDA